MTDPLLHARRLALIDELYGIGLACMITEAGAFHVFAAEPGQPQLAVENLDKLPAHPMPVAGGDMQSGGDMQADLEAAFGKIIFGPPMPNAPKEVAPEPPDPPAAIPGELPYKCLCGCCHKPDYGACPNFEATEATGFKTCVYCDHGFDCHIRDAGRDYYNTPLGYGSRRIADVIKAAQKLKIGSMDCAGGCGRTVSANKGFCLACITGAAERVVEEAEGNP